MIYAMFCIFALTFNGTCRDTTLYKYDPDGCCSRISRINDNFNGCFCYRFKVSLYLNGNPPISCLPFIFLPAVIFDKLQYKVLFLSFFSLNTFAFFYTRIRYFPSRIIMKRIQITTNIINYLIQG